MQAHEVPALPFESQPHSDDEGYAELIKARRDCVDAMFEAQSKEQDAAQARRKATKLMKAYERRLMEWNGQGTLPL